MIRAGSLYHALHQMEAEGLIEPVRTERQGNRPERTVYSINAEGRAELDILRDRGLREVRLGPDAFDVALWVAAGLPEAELASAVRERLESLARSRQALRAERRQLAERGLPPLAQALMRHGEARLKAELRWHRELLGRLPEVLRDRAEA